MKTVNNQAKHWFGILTLAITFVSPSTFASTYQVTLDTSGLSGIEAQLAFDFIDGGPLSNTINLSSFITDGMLGAEIISGGVSGKLPGVIFFNDTDFFNEYLTGITLGNSITFQFDSTNNPPDTLSVPDSFSLFLLDPLSGLSMVNTTDPTGADTLFRFDISGSAYDSPLVFDVPSGEMNVSVQPASHAIPSPSALWLIASGLGMAAFVRSKRVKHEALYNYSLSIIAFNSPNKGKGKI